MAERGQTLADLLPEVQEKVSRKAELTKSVADLDTQMVQAENLSGTSNHSQPLLGVPEGPHLSVYTAGASSNGCA